MKKFFWVITLMVIVSLVSGCGTKENKILECSMIDNQTEGISLTHKVEAIYNNNELQNIIFNYEIIFANEYIEYIDEISTSFKEQFTYLENQNGITMTDEIKENIFNLNIKADLTRMDIETKEALDIVGNNNDYKSTKLDFEEKGYTCK